ncbi:hypothetical protein PFISCL1PPCAC_674, partial [Pristionchus fissidentatus]
MLSTLKEVNSNMRTIIENMPGRPLNRYSGFNYTDKDEVCALSARTRCHATFLRLLVDSVFHGHPDAQKRLRDRRSPSSTIRMKREKNETRKRQWEREKERK